MKKRFAPIDRARRYAEALDRLGIARVGDGEELLGGHEQPAGEALRPAPGRTAPALARWYLEGAKRERAGEVQQRVILISLRQLEQRRVEVGPRQPPLGRSASPR